LKSDGAAFNPATMEAFSTHGNGTMTVVKEKSPISFEVEQNLQTMNGARTVATSSRKARWCGVTLVAGEFLGNWTSNGVREAER
jgi:hypothetical protein